MIHWMYSRYTVVGGMLGTLLAAVFASDQLGAFSGQGYNEGMAMASQFKVQLIGVISTIIYTAVISYILLKVLDKLMGLRVTDEQQTIGLDISQHNERGYDL